MFGRPESRRQTLALMTRAGHANMSTTKTYLHLAGTVFRDEAERLEARLLGPRDAALLASGEG